MNHLLEASRWLSHGKTISLEGNQLVKTSLKERLHRFFSGKYDKQCVEKVSNFIASGINASQQSEKTHFLVLADAFVSRYARNWRCNKIAKTLDRTCILHRVDHVFKHRGNVAAYTKWISQGMPPEIYWRYPDFCTFMETSGLLSQMKVTKDRPTEIDGEPAIIVEGKLEKWSQIKNRFQAVYSPEYREKFIVDKCVVYTYIGNGKGLQKHHPFITEMTPISILTDPEYEQVLCKAHEFVRQGEETLTPVEQEKLKAQRNFVIQIVTSYVDGKDTNITELIQRRQHPYLRLIMGSDEPRANAFKGNVYEFGYVSKTPLRQSLRHLLAASQGRFRSPDIWEYKQCAEKVVTNIPVTADEARTFLDYTLMYHRQGINLGNQIGFHATKQNCTTYVGSALAAANITTPVEVTLLELINRISPQWFADIKTFSIYCGNKANQAIAFVGRALPIWLTRACSTLADRISKAALRIIDAFAAISLVPARVVLGDASGDGGLAFVPPTQSLALIGPGLTKGKRWLSLSSYRFTLPGILQEWQRAQPSTVIYKRPLQLAIVP